jgi:molybdopterin/thiamine biosynthesis adenylyltransferase
MMRIFSKSNPSLVTYRCRPLKIRGTGQVSVLNRHQNVPGFIQQALSTARVILIGAGGIGGEIGEALVRKGVGTLVILDDDIVEPTNLNRQRFFARDLNKNKAFRLAKNLVPEGFCETLIQGYSLRLEEAIDKGVDLRGTLAIVGVDNNPARIAAARHFQRLAMPVIFTAVDEGASHGYVFVQEPGKTCFVCMFPKSFDDNTYPCPGTPAVKDILKVVAGMTTYAVDTLLMKRVRCWNYKQVYLDGSIPGNDWNVDRRDDCKLCQPELAVIV